MRGYGLLLPDVRRHDALTMQPKIIRLPDGTTGTIRELAERFGLQYDTARKRLQQSIDLDTPLHQGCGVRKRTSKRVQAIRTLRRKGMTMQGIGEHLGISKQAVSELLKRYPENPLR